MSEIQVLVGMVASGKSTYALQKAREGWIVVSEDATVMSVHANDYQLYATALKPLYKAVENTTVALALALGRSVIIDRVNGTKASRARWISMAKSLDVEVSAVVFPMCDSEVHASRRSYSDSRGYDYKKWLEVVEKHKASYQIPTMDEGWNYISDAPTRNQSQDNQAG